MNLTEKALIRKQISDLSSMAQELKRDLQIVQKELSKVEQLLQKKQFSKNKELHNFKVVYSQNKKDLESTLKTAHDLINQLKLEAKPRAYIQVTKKLI
jgi:hypothetical protein